MRTREEMEALIGTLNHPASCSKAQKALVEIGEPVVPLLIDALGDREISLDAAEVLREIGAVAVEPLVAALRNENKSISANAALVLEDIGQPSVEPLISALRRKSRRARILAIRALGQIGDSRAVDPLTEIFNEAVPKKSALLDAVIEALRKLGKVVEKPETSVARQRSKKSQELLLEFIEELKNKGLEVSPKSHRLYYHPQIPDIRVSIAKIVVRLERRNQRKKRWELVRSFSIARETHLALAAVDSVLDKLRR